MSTTQAADRCRNTDDRRPVLVTDRQTLDVQDLSTQPCRRPLSNLPRWHQRPFQRRPKIVGWKSATVNRAKINRLIATALHQQPED
jgi:hypothetical protein